MTIPNGTGTTPVPPVISPGRVAVITGAASGIGLDPGPRPAELR